METFLGAQYFDGISSSSKEVRISISREFHEIIIHKGNESSLTWRFDKLHFESFGESTEIRNSDFPGAVIKSDNPYFTNSFYEFMKENNRVDIHTRLLHLSKPKIILLTVGLFTSLLLAYFYALPPLAEKSATLLPESVDNELGELFMKSEIDPEDVDSLKTKSLEAFAERIDFQNRKSLRFMVVRSNQVNAFALPNGQIVIYSGLLDKLQSFEELAALLGHEASHINNRHSIKLLTRNLSNYIVVSLLLSDINGIAAILLENAQQLHTLSFSRDFEREADSQGLEILIKNHINPQGIIGLFEILENEERFEIPQILSSHPLTAERKLYLEKIITESTYNIQEHEELIFLFEQLQEE